MVTGLTPPTGGGALWKVLECSILLLEPCSPLMSILWKLTGTPTHVLRGNGVGAQKGEEETWRQHSREGARLAYGQPGFDPGTPYGPESIRSDP